MSLGDKNICKRVSASYTYDIALDTNTPLTSKVLNRRFSSPMPKKPRFENEALLEGNYHNIAPLSIIEKELRISIKEKEEKLRQLNLAKYYAFIKYPTHLFYSDIFYFHFFI